MYDQCQCAPLWNWLVPTDTSIASALRMEDISWSHQRFIFSRQACSRLSPRCLLRLFANSQHPSLFFDPPIWHWRSTKVWSRLPTTRHRQCLHSLGRLLKLAVSPRSSPKVFLRELDINRYHSTACSNQPCGDVHLCFSYSSEPIVVVDVPHFLSSVGRAELS